MKTAFRTARHDILNHLHASLLQLDVASAALESGDPDAARAAASHSRDSLREATDLIDAALSLADVCAFPEAVTLSPAPIGELINKWAGWLGGGQAPSPKGFDARLPLGSVVSTDPAKLHRIVTLLNRERRRWPGCGPIVVREGVPAGSLTLEVNGVVTPVRADAAEQHPEAPRVLAIRCLAVQLGGTAEWTPEAADGRALRITLPAALRPAPSPSR